jgi:hypothetical protein
VLDAAYWRVSRYADPAPELREVPIEAYTMSTYLDILDADISSYFSVTSMPSQAPASTCASPSRATPRRSKRSRTSSSSTPAPRTTTPCGCWTTHLRRPRLHHPPRLLGALHAHRRRARRDVLPAPAPPACRRVGRRARRRAGVAVDEYRTGRRRPARRQRRGRVLRADQPEPVAADCQSCGSAAIVSPTDPRFACTECQWGWCSLVFPSDVAAVEASLMGLKPGCGTGGTPTTPTTRTNRPATRRPTRARW